LLPWLPSLLKTLSFPLCALGVLGGENPGIPCFTHPMRAGLIPCLLWLPLLVGCARRPSPQFPIGIYAPGSTNALPILSSAGFSHVTGPATRPFLDAARNAGIQVLASPGTTAGPGFKPSVARSTVRSLDRHPALWAWYLSDEPDLNGLSAEEVRQVHSAVRHAGARKPTALVVYRGPSLATFHSADILMVDRYPVGWQPLAAFFQHMQHGAVAAGVSGRPFIAVIQAFNWAAYADVHPFPEPITSRPPSESELRAMAWGARLIGANGLFFYPYADGRWRMTEHPETWRALTHVVREIRDRSALFTAPRAGLPPKAELLDPSRRFNEVLEPALLWSVVQVETASPTIPAGTYWILVNTTGESHQIRLREPAWAGVVLHDLDRTEPRKVDADGWMEAIHPYEVRLLGPLPDPR